MSKTKVGEAELQRFKEWWDERKHNHPIPSNPWQAYSIDCSLHARQTSRRAWKNAVNWTDYPPLDDPANNYPQNPHKPSRGHRRPTFIPSHQRTILEQRTRTAHEWTPAQKKFQQEAIRMKDVLIEKYHIPDVQFHWEAHSDARKGAYWRGIPAIGDKPWIRIGLKGTPSTNLVNLAVVAHELGHHTDYYGGYRPRESGAATGWHGATRNEHEREAWRTGRFLFEGGAHAGTKVQRVGRWTKKWALGTYLGTSPTATEQTREQDRKDLEYAKKITRRFKRWQRRQVK